MKASRVWAKALSLCQRSLEIREQVLGADHPDTATSLNNLAYLYKSQGRYAEAASLYSRAIAIDRRRSVPRDLQFAFRLLNLAQIYEKLEQPEQAKKLFQEIVVILRAKLPKNHAQLLLVEAKLRPKKSNKSKSKHRQSKKR